MFGKLKNILGIEGVKAKLLLPVVTLRKAGSIKGKIQLMTLSDQTVNSIHLKVIEKYARGRKESKLIDEYVLGETIINGPIALKKDEEKLIDFDLAYEVLKSEMDQMEESNIFSKGVVKLAKYLKNVQSTYRIEASIDVEGTKLNPTVSEIVEFK